MTCGTCGKPRSEHYDARLFCPLGKRVKPGSRFTLEQPRLPEAGAVRELDHDTPTFDAPFTLDGGHDTTVREVARSLFEVR